jgi:hypothetical protein
LLFDFLSQLLDGLKDSFVLFEILALLEYFVCGLVLIALEFKVGKIEEALSLF